jgi:hypothetical protein
VWRLFLGAILVCACARIVWKGRGYQSLYIGGGCVGLSALVCLTGHQPCNGTKHRNCETRQEASQEHGAIVIESASGNWKVNRMPLEAKPNDFGLTAYDFCSPISGVRTSPSVEGL